MIEEETLYNSLRILSKAFYKIIEVDLNTGLFYPVKLEEPTPHKFTKVWAIEFAEDNIHPDDKDRFLEFFDAEKTKEWLKFNWMRRCFYRRKVGNKWRRSCMEVVPMDNYSEDDAIVLLTVRDIEDYIKDFREQELPF